MTDCNCSPFGVQFGLVYAQLLYTISSLACESFVDFPDVNVRDVESISLHQDGNGNSWTDSHNVRRASRNCVVSESSQDGQPLLFSKRPPCQQHSCSPVGHLRAITCCGAAIFFEGRLQLGQTLHGGFPNSIIFINGNLFGISICINNLCLNRNYFLYDIGFAYFQRVPICGLWQLFFDSRQPSRLVFLLRSQTSQQHFQMSLPSPSGNSLPLHARTLRLKFFRCSLRSSCLTLTCIQGLSQSHNRASLPQFWQLLLHRPPSLKNTAGLKP